MVKLQATAELQRSATTKPAVKGLETAGSVAPAVAGAWRLRVTPSISRSSCALVTSRAGSAAPSSQRSEEHTSELQSLMRISYAVFCLKKKHKKSKRL